MSERLPVFHIGANKAGSTTLQKALFARHPEVVSLGKPAPVPAAQSAVADVLRGCDRREVDPPEIDAETVSARWCEAVESARAQRRVPVFSREELIRHYFYGDPDTQRLPRAITNMVGPARIVIVARHQVKLIESLYIHKTNTTNYQAPDEWFQSEPELYAYGYRFHDIADAWAQTVGEENVGVFLFEEMVKDAATFARRLCDFIEIDPEIGAHLLTGQHENVRKSKRTQTYVRIRSALLPNRSLGNLLPAPLRRAWRGYLEGGHGARVELPREWLARIEDYYRNDNRRLAERFGLPLQSHGYPI